MSMFIPLQPGVESECKIGLVLELCRFNQNTHKAMVKYFVHGWSLDLLAFTFGIRKPNLVRSITRMNDVCAIAWRLHEE